jgi:hypothetical protein
MMASAYTKCPGFQGHEITGKLENGQVYISLTDMAQDAGRNPHEYGLPETAKNYVSELAAYTRIPPQEYYQEFKQLEETGGEMWASQPLAQHFGEWLDLKYWGRVNGLCNHIRTLEKHTYRDVQVEQVKQQYGNTSGESRDKEVAQLHARICRIKTERTPDEWKAYGKEQRRPSEKRGSGLEVIRHFRPARAAEISYMHYLLRETSLSFDEAEEKSRAERGFFEEYCSPDEQVC